MRKRLALLLTATAAVSALLAPPAIASTTVTVTGDGHGWTFNPDPNNATPVEFNFAQHNTGLGALEVTGISATNRFEKFIALHTLGIPAADLSSISYDFMIAGTGSASDASDFYINVYANVPGSSTYYDCRFDYVASTGAPAQWATHAVSAIDTPSAVAARNGATCTTLAAMDPGSTVSSFTLNVGDTSLNDAGLGGYLDDVVVTTTAGATTYDFEPSADACKAAWQAEGFANRGDCISAVHANN